MKKPMFKKTITSIFLVPVLKINRKDLFDNNFLNGYIKDKDSDLYKNLKGLVFLLFKPKEKDGFKEFLAKEYERTDFLLDDYSYEDYVVLVYLLNDDYIEDINLIMNSHYSKVSAEFKEIFPKKVRDFNKKNVSYLPSLQHLIFEKNKSLMEHWEKSLGIKYSLSETALEAWSAWDIEKETLDITKINEDD